jgi:hypothetical protein
MLRGVYPELAEGLSMTFPGYFVAYKLTLRKHKGLIF